MPPAASTYALPADLRKRLGIRRHGFHGTSHAYVARQAARWLGEDWRNLRIITCHLGNGASITAVDHGRSVDTSMGMTPLEGLVMGTRCGDLDPGVMLMLMRQGWDAETLDRLLNRESGLAGLSGRGPDMRDIEAAAAEGDAAARLAIDVACHRLRRYIGGFAAVMGGVDAIVFTAGIGEHSAQVRRLATRGLSFMGAHLDDARNDAAVVDTEHPVAELSADHSRVRILAIRTDEQHEIALQSQAAVGGDAGPTDRVAEPLSIPIAVSARHVHLTDEAVEALFGPGHTLTPVKPLSQPGQYAAAETVTLHGPKGSIAGVRVLGPTRRACQVEIARTDEFRLGLDAPVRRSGDVAGSAPIVLEGPAGRLELPEGAICAWRHIHMRPQDAAACGVQDGDIVEVAVDSDGRDLVFGDVLVRVSDRYALEMHVDTDEANAAELARGQTGALVATSGRARVLRRQAD
ncbi:MAG: phosphate propanoyltransferase, partial [Deltaproteobacteria bacterium]